MTIRKSATVAFGIAIACCAVVPATISAQDTTVPPLPRNNVRGGALAARRPGTWIQSGVSTTSQRISIAITDFGGVNYTQEGPPPSIRDEVLPALVEIFLGIVDQFSLVLQTLIQSGTLPTTGT
jgi:hypothetical protein